MQPTSIQGGQITGNVLLYTQPEPLSIEEHGKLGLKRSDRPFDFANSATAVPIQITEFGPASLSYPIIFAGEQLAPLAVLGVRQAENLFVARDGGFEPNVYVPAFIRRYPFVLADSGADGQMIVCIERTATALVKGGDVPLFENGQPSAFTQAAIKFCTDFETERQRTDQFIQTLKSLDLTEPKQATFTPLLADGTSGQPIQLADYFAVSDEKLAQLPAETVVELHRSGALRQIHAHLNSMFNWERLVSRSNERGPLAANA